MLINEYDAYSHEIRYDSPFYFIILLRTTNVLPGSDFFFQFSILVIPFSSAVFSILLGLKFSLKPYGSPRGAYFLMESVSQRF